jgi:hypothetical protein
MMRRKRDVPGIELEPVSRRERREPAGEILSVAKNLKLSATTRELVALPGIEPGFED